MATPSEARGPIEWLATLGDLARLRLLRLLERHELSVGELAAALQLPQSTVSRHLKRLLEEGWVTRRSAGTSGMYVFAGDDLPRGAIGIWTITRGEIDDTATTGQDDHRAAEVLSRRQIDSGSFFESVGGQWSHLRHALFGSTFTAQALIAMADPTWAVVDMGCGTGSAAELLAPWVGSVIGIDREPAMLQAARDRLKGVPCVEFIEADATDLPLKDDSADVVLIVLLLHHLTDPNAAINEAARILRPGGKVIVIDMVTHERDEYRVTMGHQHFGFNADELAEMAERSGLRLGHWQRLRPDTNATGPDLFSATLLR